MLALTPAPLQTAGERALFGELTRWDTGASVRAAVVASIPLVDGPLERRLCDAILFVPEGLAVVRVVEVLRQSGVVTALPEGVWTIEPETGPSQPLQLSGGGSTPLDGLMRAGMDTAMKLRRAGLEPGRIARLTVLVGEVTGLVPADGDLGEGDHVARLEPRSLLLGIARASRYAGVDNPRLWTTADVRAALEALGLQGRGPSVEELNGEGFPYSPYVLRRPQLLTPAAMAASPAAAGPEAPVPPTVPPTGAVPGAPESSPVREQPSPSVIAQAVAASAAAAQAATAPAEPGVVPAQAEPGGGQPSPPEDNGIGGLFPLAGPGQPESPARPAATSVFPVSPQAPAASPQAAAAPPPAAPFSYWTEEPQAGAPAPESNGSRRRIALLSILALVILVALGVGGWLVLRDQGDDRGGAGTTTQTVEPAPTGPEVGTVQEVAGKEYVVEAVQLDETCIGNAYGDTAAFFATTDCTGLSRALYSTEIAGEAVVVSVVRVQMPDTASARELRALTDRNGSGNVSDLLREGVRYTGSPAELSRAQYDSALSGPIVTIVETAWVDEDAQRGSAEIDEAAEDGLALVVPPFPAD